MEKPSVVQRRRHLKRHARRAARRVLPFLASLFLATPLAGPVSKSMASAQPNQRLHIPAQPATQLTAAQSFEQRLQSIYSSLGAEAQGLRYPVFAKAMTGYLNLQKDGKLNAAKPLLTVVDFDLPSTEKRLWVLDLAQKQVLFHTLVAHGHNSGENQATNFSNTNESNMSSLGFYVTAGEYQGKHGRSLKLQGLDEGFNTNAAMRSVVMHGADYVSENFIKQNGRLGRSLGCPALPMDLKDAIIEAVGGGSCLFLNASTAEYSSKFLNQDVAQQVLAGTVQTS
ncbi:murein L,D-transpeptidase catalytic domain family protein [uncultured Hymenobacter sp.]|uniref:murein L,D-transpeptidase catalytic domain family protein n=1 Tax=uncultured Hymenobacter sp. TaxID=170016 RepID=UPI0035C994CC